MQPIRLQANQSWHNQSPEKRPFRRHAVRTSSGSGSSAAQAQAGNAAVSQEAMKIVPVGQQDVYPQDPRQEEDKMTSDRLSRGYQLPLPAEEYDSLMVGVIGLF